MIKRNAWGLLLAAACAASAPAALADVKAGVDAWARGDYPTAVREWQGPAERGDPDALFNLGQAYKLGRGVKADLVKSEEMFGRAAAKGHLQASDIYGLLLFQRGERAKGLPYVRAAADRGEPRAQYLLGVAHFNGDGVAKDWPRAYALTSLARQAGVDQARGALAQMDRFIPLEQRQQGAALAPELASRAEAARARQMAAVDLGTTVGNPAPAGRAPVVTAAPRATSTTRVPTTPSDNSPRSAGADFARPQASRPATSAATTLRAQPAPPAVARAAPSPAPAASRPAGRFAVQLGAFSVAANADALWNRVKSRPELSGRQRQLVSAGGVTRLVAGGFASRAAAIDACAALSAAGIGCIVPRN